MADDSQDIYDDLPVIAKTVSDIKKIRNMFEKKPIKFNQPRPTGPPPAEQVKSPGSRTFIGVAPKMVVATNSDELQQIRTKLKHGPGPSLPAKGKINSNIVNGNVGNLETKTESPPIPSKPQTKPKPQIPSSERQNGDNSSVKTISSTSPVGKTEVTYATANKDRKESSSKENEVEYIGEEVTVANGDKYRKVKYVPSGGPPKKLNLPANVDISDIVQQYAVEDDIYDDAATDGSIRRVSEIPVFSEEEEKALARGSKVQTEDDQEIYDDVAAVTNITGRSVSMMSDASDIYETCGEAEQAGGDVRL